MLLLVALEGLVRGRRGELGRNSFTTFPDIDIERELVKLEADGPLGEVGSGWAMTTVLLDGSPGSPVPELELEDGSTVSLSLALLLGFFLNRSENFFDSDFFSLLPELRLVLTLTGSPSLPFPFSSFWGFLGSVSPFFPLLRDLLLLLML